jgi:acid phosphatase type 7
MRRYRPILGLVVAAISATVITAPAPLIAASQPQGPPNHGEDVSGFVIAAVGDLVPHPNLSSDANARAVKRLADSHQPDAYFLLGDLQYETGVLALYRSVYDPIWGDVKQDSYPTAGNHEYGNGVNSGWASTGGGYFDYYGNRARPGSASYYWFHVNLPAGGRWLVVVLNSACGDYDNPPEWHTPLCTTDSAQANWLRSVLAANQHIRCIMAVFHEPRFATAAPVPGKPSMATLWNVMDNEGAARGVDLVLNGHNHAYERLKPMIFNGTIDHSRGIWSTIVGTGGRDLIPFRGTVHPARSAADDDHFGFLKLVLRSDGWTQSFKRTDGTSFDTRAFGCNP